MSNKLVIRRLFTSPAIGHSLIWAAMMIAAGVVLRGTDHAKDILLLQIVGWTATSSLIARLGQRKSQQECR